MSDDEMSESEFIESVMSKVDVSNLTEQQTVQFMRIIRKLNPLSKAIMANTEHDIELGMKLHNVAYTHEALKNDLLKDLFKEQK